MRHWLTGVLVTVTAAAGLTQTPASQQRPPVFRSGVDVVQIDVSVLDKDRKPVRSLTAADFEVKEDGKLQDVVVVSEQSFPDEAAPPPVWTRAAAPDVATTDADGKRVFMLLFDVGSLKAQIGLGAPGLNLVDDHGAIDAVRHVAYGVLDRIGPDDLVAITGASGRGVMQPFTNDLDKLYTAIDNLSGKERRPLEFPGQQRTNRQREATGEIGGLHMLRNLTEYMMAMPERRKAIVYIGRGFGIPVGLGGLPEYLAETLHNAQLGNINIYAINPFVLGPTARDSNRLDGLIALADNTGGTSINHPRDLETGLEQIFLENGSYYMVGYRTSNVAMDGRFRRISVKVRGRDDLIVRSRNQIYRPKSERADGVGPTMKPSADMRPGMGGLLPNLDVALSAVAMPFAHAGRREAAVPIAIALAEPVAPGTTRIVQSTTVRILAYAERGDLVKDVRLPVPIDVSPGVETRLAYEVVPQLDLVPGQYSIRVVAQNHLTDKLGSIEFDVTVPDFTRDGVTTSAIALSVAGETPLVSAEPLAALLPAPPTARRQFRSSERVTAFARIYQGGQAPLAAVRLDARVLSATGAVIVNASETLVPDRFAGARTVDWTLDLPLDRLEPGHYLLTLQASLGARHAPKRDVRFSVR